MIQCTFLSKLNLNLSRKWLRQTLLFPSGQENCRRNNGSQGGVALASVLPLYEWALWLWRRPHQWPLGSNRCPLLQRVSCQFGNLAICFSAVLYKEKIKITAIICSFMVRSYKISYDPFVVLTVNTTVSINGAWLLECTTPKQMNHPNWTSLSGP